MQAIQEMDGERGSRAWSLMGQGVRVIVVVVGRHGALGAQQTSLAAFQQYN